MKVTSISIENFLSIEKADIDFDESGLLLIEGYNYDVDRANGAGKTAILNALSFALYERVPRKITASEMLRRGTKKGCVTVTVVSGAGRFMVKRSRPKGVTFFKEQDTGFEEVNLTQAEWEKILGITYNQFIVSAYCSQSGSSLAPRFLLLNDTDKKQFLLQLLDLEEFSLCKKKADDNIQQLTADTNRIQQSIDILQSKIEAFSESLIDESEVNLQISKLRDAQERLNSSLKELETVPKPDLSKFQQIEDGILAKRTEFSKLKERRDMLMSKWFELKSQIKPFKTTDTCPTCGTKIDNSHARSIHEAEIAQLTEEQKLVKVKIDDIDTRLLEENKINSLAIKLKEKKQKASTDYQQANLQRIDILAKVQNCKSSITIFEKKLNDNVNLTNKIQNSRLEQTKLATQIEGLKKEIDLQKTVSSIYSPTGAQAYILDSAIELFNEQIAKYIGILWSNLTYELQSYKENVRGEVTAKFSESIVMDGRPISLGSLSGGELRALSICADMAILGLLEQQFGIHASPVIFDEAFDGLDANGKEFALDLIKELAQNRQVIVIDHASEMRTAFDKILRVEKRNGISSVGAIT